MSLSIGERLRAFDIASLSVKRGDCFVPYPAEMADEIIAHVDTLRKAARSSGWSDGTIDIEGAIFEADGKTWVVGKRVDFSAYGLYEDDRRRHQDECR